MMEQSGVDYRFLCDELRKELDRQREMRYKAELELNKACKPLAVEPSENIQSFVFKIRRAIMRDASDQYFEAEITARDERIRRECESESNSIISDLLDVFDALNGKKYMTADRGRKIIDNARASIMGEAKK